MSGTETLIPYLKDKKNVEEKPTVIVDSREANTASKIVKGLVERGVNIKTECLKKGDYILSDQCAVERKTVNDFVYTLTRRYLFEQLFRLKDEYPKSIMVLEGYMPIIYKYSNIQPAAIWGAMFNLAKNGISLISTSSYKETIDFLYTAARQLYFVASLPNIGREKANAILESYQTPLKALINVDDWVKSVNGLGPIISNKVKEVLNTPFEKPKEETGTCNKSGTPP
jgi:DNA excision repair protein ERCC-4